MKEFCECGHSIKSHVADFNNTRCCCVWQTKEDLDNRGSLLRFCECMEYSREDEKARSSDKGMDSSSKIEITNALKSNSNKRDDSPHDNKKLNSNKQGSDGGII